MSNLDQTHATDLRLWSRIKDHKLIQATLAYLAAGLAIAHGEELIAHAYGWPQTIDRVVITLLGLGLPLVLVLVTIAMRSTTADSRAAVSRTLDRVFLLVLAVVVVALVSERALPYSPSAQTQLGRLLQLALGLLVVALLADRFWLGRPLLRDARTQAARGPATDSQTPAVGAGVEAASAARSIAVLPFANLSSDPEQEYFSDGLSEELINHLAHVKGLRVLARTSSFAFKGKNEDLRSIGDKLSVSCVLEGSVRKAGNRLRITAQLVDCINGYHLWSETFDRELNDVFAIQHDISAEVASGLGTTLGFAGGVPPGGTRNLEAYDLYLRAQSLYRLIRPTEIKRAADLFRQALSLDPEFALAWIGLAQTLVLVAAFVPEVAAQVEPEWGHAVERAHSIAPGLASTHLADVIYQMARRHWLEADEALRKAKSLTSRPVEEPLAACAVFAAVGRAKEATSEGYRARSADPLNLLVSSVFQISLTIAGDYDEADKEYIRSRDLVGDRTAAEDAAVRRAWARGLPLSDIQASMQLYLEHTSVPMQVERDLGQLLDRPESARGRLRLAFEEPAYQDPTRQFKIATWAAQFGDADLALRAARRAFIDMRSWSVHLIWLPTYREVRKDPGFKALLRDLGIVAYWRSSGNWGDFARPLGHDDFQVW